MKRAIVCALYCMLSMVLVALTGCGGGNDGGIITPQRQQMLTGVSWMYENAPADFSNNAYSCSLIVGLNYDVTIAAADIDSFIVTSPSGGTWTPPAAGSEFGTSSNGQPYISRRLIYTPDTKTFPLAGTWSFQLKLKNGAISAPLQRTFHNPGSSAAATYGYVYAPEDPSRADAVALLRRFPSTGYTLQYSPAAGGSITSTGLSPVADAYRAQEPRAFNVYCALYDASGNHLGNSAPAFSTVDHSSSPLMTAAGELNLVPALTQAASGTGTVDLARVSYLRVVVVDGGQYAPNTYASWDNRSLSLKVPVLQPSGRALEEALLTPSTVGAGVTFISADTLGGYGSSAVSAGGNSAD